MLSSHGYNAEVQVLIRPFFSWEACPYIINYCVCVNRSKSVRCQKLNKGARKMAQRLGVLGALPKVLSSFPSNHIVAHNHLQ